MKLKIKFYALPLLMVLLSACKKEGEIIVKPLKALRPYTMQGFALKPLDQYFDGVKVREILGPAQLNGYTDQRIIFYKDEMAMELKSKTGETLYQQNFNINSASNDVPKFYYDGMKIQNSYTYPEGVSGVEQVNFYFDIPLNMPVDIAYGDGSDVNTVQYLARNVQPQQWTGFINIPPLEGDMLYVLLLKPGKQEYLINNDVNYSYVQMQLPTKNGYQGGGVQSWYIGFHQKSGILTPQVDLVQMFPK